MRPTVFLDRDGTLNAEVGFVTHPGMVAILPGVATALARLHAAGFRLVVVTNQSGIARGLYTESDLAAIHALMQERIEAPVSAWLHCPHHPEADGPYGGECSCRKPKAGLLHQARELLGIDFAGSFLVGDSARDLRMAAGLPIRGIYCRSGKPPDAQLAELARHGCRPAADVADLPAAVEWILGTQK